MLNVESTQDIIKSEYQLRREKNDKYSLRAFAKTLDVSPTYLSFIFRGQRQLTQSMLHQFGRKLLWSKKKQEYISLLIEFESAKSDKEKLDLLHELQKYTSRHQLAQPLSVDIFSLIYEWQHSAILAFLTLPKVKKNDATIAQRLNIPIGLCLESLKRLKRLNLISTSKNSQWMSLGKDFSVASIPSQSIRCYHKDILRKAMVAIDNQAFEKRDFANFVFTIDPKNISVIKEKIKAFHKDISQYSESGYPVQIYQFSTQLFRIDRDENH